MPKTIKKTETPAPPAVLPAAALPEERIFTETGKRRNVELAFDEMLACLKSLPGMQGAHGDGCHCQWCMRIRAAIAGAEAAVKAAS